MGAYILRRLLLIIPTLLGIMIVNFALVQFVPGGPVEQAIARAQGQGDVFGGFAGTDGESTLDQDAPQNDQYIGARGLPPEFIEQLEKEFGFDKPPLTRFLNMMWNYVRFDFGTSYFRSERVVDLVIDKMPSKIHHVWEMSFVIFHERVREEDTLLGILIKKIVIFPAIHNSHCCSKKIESCILCKGLKTI